MLSWTKKMMKMKRRKMTNAHVKMKRKRKTMMKAKMKRRKMMKPTHDSLSTPAAACPKFDEVQLECENFSFKVRMKKGCNPKPLVS